MANFGRFILVKKAGIEVGRVRYMNLRPHQHGTSLFHQFFPKREDIVLFSLREWVQDRCDDG